MPLPSLLFHRLKRLMPRRFKSWEETPSFFLLLLAMTSLAEAWFYGSALAAGFPEFGKALNTAPAASYMSGSFLACLILLVLIGSQLVVWTVIAQGCLAHLQKRMFGV